MNDLASWLFSSQGFMPHGHCYLWQPGTLWLNVGSDGLIAAAYFAIPLSLYSFVKRRISEIPFPAIFLMFAAFILLCGSTHIMEIWTVWNPDYRLSGALKLLTGIVSLATTIALFRLMPLALQLRSPRELRQEVEMRTAELAQANVALRRTIAELERQTEELHATHRQKNESLALLATTLRSVGDAVISTDGSGNIRFMNTIAESLTGWSEQEARGRPLDGVFRVVNERTREPVESPVATVLRERGIAAGTDHTALISRDETERPIEDSGAPIIDGGQILGVVVVFRDVTGQRAHQRALLDSEQRFRAAIDAVQGVVWTNAANGEMLGEQPGWSALTGQQVEQYQGFGWSAAVHPDDAQPTIDAWRAAVLARRPFIFEHRVRRHDAKWRRFSIRAIPLMDAHGAVREWVGVHIDVTEQREAERNLRETEMALREANRRKDVFLATLSHELRNPLAPIRNAASLLAKPALSSEAHERGRLIIVRQVRHMASLLDDLLDVSRITRGVFVLKRSHVNLQSLLSEAVDTARPLIDAKRHTLNLDWPSTPIEVEADPTRLVQMATNLLTNAAKYTDAGGLITFTVRTEGEEILLCVRDTGIGLAPEMLTKVFEMFSQVAPEHERTEGGLGIGLALVKGLVELHGGRVEASSEGLGRGSEFVVVLPGLRVAGGTLSHTPSDLGQAVALRVARRILIADDNRDGAESLAMLVEAFGYEVHVAHTGPDALRAAATHRPHAAVLDIGMPGMDGYKVAQRIRGEAWGSHMTLIALTGWGQENDRRRAQHAGFDHHLTKPVDPTRLDQLLAMSDRSMRNAADWNAR
jgi:PAS domain S-box-containing protein